MGLFEVKGRARFEAAGGATAPALLQLLERRLREADAAAVSITSDGLAFTVGPSFLRLDLWFRPLNPLRGIHEGRVSLAMDEGRLLVTHELRVQGRALLVALLLGVAVLALLDGLRDGFSTRLLAVAAAWLVGSALAFLASRGVVAVRFERFLEKSLAPQARPLGVFETPRG